MFFSSWLQQLAQRWSPRGGKRRRRAGRTSASTRRQVRPRLEALEERLCPSDLSYTVVAVAQTGASGSTVKKTDGSKAGTLTNVSDASINDSGNVAFLGTLNGDNSGVDEATLANGTVKSLYLLSYINHTVNLPNFSFPQIDNKGEVIAQDKDQVGSNIFESYIRTWQPNETGKSVTDAQGNLPGQNDIVLHPTISPDGTQFAYQRQLDSGQLNLFINNYDKPVSPLLSRSTGFYEEIANDGAVVVEDGVNSSDQSIKVYQIGRTPVTIANSAYSNSAYFSELGPAPGISPDGQFIAFFGNLTNGGAIALNKMLANSGVPALNGGPPASTKAPPYVKPGPGIFLSVATKSHGQVIMEVTSLANDSNASMRVAVTSDNVTSFPTPYTKGNVLVAFMGPDTNNPSKNALYCNQIDLFGAPGKAFDPADPQQFRVNTNTIVAETGDSINGTSGNNGVAGNITSLSIYDPINNKDQVTFCVSTDQKNSAVVEANVIPVLAVPNLKQFTSYEPGQTNWADQTYAYGEVNSHMKSVTGGSGYTSAPDVEFSSPGGGGVKATGYATIANKQVTQVIVKNPGQGYTTAPSITFTGGGGTGAKATPKLDTISNAGCTITAIAAALNYVGYPNFNYNGATSYTPATLDNLLKSHLNSKGVPDGYSEGGKPVLTYATQIAADAAGIPLIRFVPLSYPNPSSLSALASLLQSTHAPVLVRVNGNGHSVLVTGESAGEFTIVDPGSGNITTLDDPRGYKNQFFIRGYFADPPDVSALDFDVEAGGTGVNLRVTNPTGQQTGTDASGSTVVQIPQSSTASDPSEDDFFGTTPPETDQSVSITQPLVGTYTVSVTGTTAEPFTLMVYGVGTDGTLEPSIIETGTVTPGTPITFTVPYTSQPPLSLSESSIAVTPGVIAAGDSATVTLTTRDGVGNQMPSGGQKISFTLGSGKGSGTFGTVKDNGDGTYTTTFTGTTAGSNTITATINGQEVTSAAPTVTVAVASVVTTNPSSQIATAGDSVSFVAAAVGSPAPTVQWQVSTDSGSTFNNIAGANSTTLTLTPTSDQNDNEYRAVFTNSKGSATTTPATLTVNSQPSGLVISSSTGVFPQFNLAHPGSDFFGTQVITLSTGNIVVNGGNAGAIYLFNGQTGALISTLTGNPGDSMEITALTNGNFVVADTNWNNGVGAVTWGSGITGVSGPISAANSLIGTSQGGFQVFAITPLANGNYVVSNAGWHDGFGAVTWGNGSTGTTGIVSAANSLVGSTINDLVGSGNSSLGGVVALTNGNYVVDSMDWNGGAGAVTWADGTTGVVGTISAANSLVGKSAGDQVGLGGVTALINGNYVVDSFFWNGQAGAVTWANGTTGIAGVASAANSLVGSSTSDQVGLMGVTALTNGNYVVASPNWNIGKGAATWGNGTTGITGTISATNSLVGNLPTNTGCEVSWNGITALANGNYVVNSSRWNGQGAVTWGNGATGTTGDVSAANSLICHDANQANSNADVVVLALTNGNYLVWDSHWNGDLGEVTWGNGATGITGTVSAANSLVGTNPGDLVGGGRDVIALTNGNYVVASPYWNFGEGAVTWGNGITGIVGTISDTNSLVGSYPSKDQVGNDGLKALANGNYVVLSNNVNGLGATATWGDGTKGTTGTISASNSLNNLPANSANGPFYVTSLPDGNYLVSAYLGDGNGFTTWVDGATGKTLDGQNSVDSQNTLMGASAIGPSASSTSSAFLAGIAATSTVTTGFTDPNQLTFTFGEGQTFNVTPDFITRALNAGIDVTLQSNNDIVINSPIIENPTVTPGSLTLEAGRSIILNASIKTAGGNLTLIANDSKADGVVDSEHDPGDAVITEQSGATIDTGTGTLTVDLKNSTDKTNNGVGSVTLPNVNASSETLSSNSTVGITITGTTPGDGVTTGTYTQLNVSGAINLNGAPLAITHSAVTAKGTTFIIVQSTEVVSGTFNGLNEGAAVTASDGTEFTISYKGNGGKEVELTQITPTPQAPVFTNSTATSFTVGSAGSFKVAASGYPAATLSESSSDTLPKGVTFSAATGVLSGTPSAGSGGTYTLNFTATNSLGSVSQTFTLTVNQAPAITSGNSIAFAIGYDDSFIVTATGSPTPTLKESGALPSGVSFTDNGDGTATLAGIPAAGTAGTYHFSITAHNGVGSDFIQSFTLTVSQPQAPVITSVASTAFTIGHGGSFTVNATGYPTPTLTESGALPSGVTFTDYGNGTATFGGTPAAGTKGTYQINITAENGLGSAYTQGFNLTVNLSPPPPPPPPVLPPPHPVLPPPLPHPPIVPPLLALFNQFLGDLETVNTNGTTITDNLFGFPMVETYDYFGNLVSVTLLGFDVTFLFG